MNSSFAMAHIHRLCATKVSQSRAAQGMFLVYSIVMLYGLSVNNIIAHGIPDEYVAFQRHAV